MNELTRIVEGQSSRTGFTARDFERLMEIGAFEDMRVELAGGVLEKMQPSSMAHGERNGSVWALLRSVFAESVRVGVDVAVRLDATTVRAPDVVVATGEVERGALDAAQVLLAVEISDATLGRDLGLKRAEYAASGIPHYWVVEVNARIVHLMSDPVEGDYRTETVARFGEAITVPGTDRTITID